VIGPLRDLVSLSETRLGRAWRSSKHRGLCEVVAKSLRRGCRVRQSGGVRVLNRAQDSGL